MIIPDTSTSPSQGHCGVTNLEISGVRFSTRGNSSKYSPLAAVCNGGNAITTTASSVRNVGTIICTFILSPSRSLAKALTSSGDESSGVRFVSDDCASIKTALGKSCLIRISLALDKSVNMPSGLVTSIVGYTKPSPWATRQ